MARNEMGPWFVRNVRQPFLPGCSYETLVRLAGSGALRPTTIMRGPTTRQLWAAARRVPCVAHLVGYCHACNAKVPDGVDACPSCGERFVPWLERDRLGLPAVALTVDEVPGLVESEADADVEAAAGAIVPHAAVHEREVADESEVLPGGLEASTNEVATGYVTSAEAIRAARAHASARAGSGAGAWTVTIGGLVVALAVVGSVPWLLGGDDANAGSGADADVASAMVSPGDDDEGAGPRPDGVDGDPVANPAEDDSRRRAARRAGRDSDLPPGSFRIGGRRSAAEPTVPAAVPDPNPEAESSLETGIDTADDEAAAEATKVTDAVAPRAADGPSDPAWRLRRLRRVGSDRERPWRERLDAWRAAERLRSELGPETASEILDRDAIRAGIEEVHLTAFLAGVDPAEFAAEDAPRR